MRLEFDGVDDYVPVPEGAEKTARALAERLERLVLYCPACDDYTMEWVGENELRCRRCGLRKVLHGIFIWFDRPLSDEEIERLWREKAKLLEALV